MKCIQSLRCVYVLELVQSCAIAKASLLPLLKLWASDLNKPLTQNSELLDHCLCYRLFSKLRGEAA